MTDLTFDAPCIVFALRRESLPFLRQFRPQQCFGGAPCWAMSCGSARGSVLVLQAGIGKGPTEAALHWLLSRPAMAGVPYRPKVVLSAGFSGALQDGLQVGDIILASEVTSTEGGCWPTTWPTESEGEWQPPLHRGRVLSAPSLIACPQEKRRLGQDRQATAVDMETAALARMCAARGVTFGCVRVISDDLKTELSPRLVSLLSGARVSPLRSLMTLLRSPALVGQFAHLAKRTRFAAERLGKVLGELLTLTLHGSTDP